MKPKSKILVIAGSDSSGGAGIQADIKTITALGSYAMTAITAVTIQNTTGVKSIVPIDPKEISNQIEFTSKDIKPDAVKIGMLHSTKVIKSVIHSLNLIKVKKIILDPVMVAKGGAKLIDDKAIQLLKNELIKKVSLITPNIPEAEILTDTKIQNISDMEKAGNLILKLGASHVILKGGHLESNEITDILIDYNGSYKIQAIKSKTMHTHGTGCTMASAFSAGIAKSFDIKDAFEMAHSYVNKAILSAPKFGNGHGPINHCHSINVFQY